MVGILSETEITETLQAALYGHLGCHAEGKTYVVPFSYAVDGNRLIGYTIVGMKIEMMRKNPEVCVQVDIVESLTHWKSVICGGRFEELSGMEAAKAMVLLIDRYGPIFDEDPSQLRRGRDITPPRLQSGPSPYLVYCIHLGEKSGRFERNDTMVD